MKALVTGGCGFLGGHVVDRLLARGIEVVDVDSLTYAGDPDRHQGTQGYTRIHEDVRRLHPDAIARLGPFDLALHLAAESHVDNSLLRPLDGTSVNVMGTVRLLDLARHLEIPKVLVMSTDEVTGALAYDEPPTDEQSPIRPSSPYSASKAAAELLALAYHKSFKLPVVVARSTNLVGPGQHPEKFIPRAITHMLADRAAPLFGAGLQVRDWLAVQDGADGVLAIAERGTLGEVYCLGARQERTNCNVLAAIAAMLNGRFESIPDRPGHDLRYATDPTRAETQLGWHAAMSFETALEQTIAWYRDNDGWWRRMAARGGAWAR